jgi:hypothetical protein
MASRPCGIGILAVLREATGAAESDGMPPMPATTKPSGVGRLGGATRQARKAARPSSGTGSATKGRATERRRILTAAVKRREARIAVYERLLSKYSVRLLTL